MKLGTLFVISAPSGGGKTSLVNALLAHQEFKDILARVVTYTSRQPRPGDIHGQDYYFIQEMEFVAFIEKGFFIEWSVAYGTYYGTPAKVLEDLAQGNSRIVILDRTGAKNIAIAYPEAILIWIVPPSIEVLTRRLQGRGTENRAQIERRIALAVIEMESEVKNPLFSHYITNDFFEVSLNSLKNIVIFALKLKK